MLNVEAKKAPSPLVREEHSYSLANIKIYWQLPLTSYRGPEYSSLCRLIFENSLFSSIERARIILIFAPFTSLFSCLLENSPL